MTPLRSSQAGITLLESMVSLLILAVGVLGLLGVQLRTLAETQTGVRRAQAVRAIEDLAERTKSNPGGFALLSDYQTDGWTALGAKPAVDCTTAACTPLQLAQHDLYDWRNGVQSRLPQGQTMVFGSSDESADDKRQLGVVIAWRANERSTSNNYVAPLAVPLGTSGVTCPDAYICHLAYVQP